MKEIARVARGKNNIETARAFSKCECFHLLPVSEILSTMRHYGKSGLLVFTDTEAILFHDYES